MTRLTLWLAVLLIVACLAACGNHPVPPAPYLGFVANQESNTVAVVDLAHFCVIRAIPVAPEPIGLAVRPQTHEVWVTSAAGTLTVLDFPALNVRRAIKVGRSARDLSFSTDGRKAFVLDQVAGEIAAFNTGAREEVRLSRVRVVPGARLTDPEASPATDASPSLRLVATPDGRTLIVADAVASKLYFVSASSLEILGSVEVGKKPSFPVVLPDSSKVFVADVGEEKISAVDVMSRRVLSHIEIGVTPGAMLAKPDGGELFILSPSSTLVIVDAFHDNAEQNFPLGRDPASAVIRRDQTVLYVANGDGTVMAIDVQNRQPLSSTLAGGQPLCLALTPDERFLAVGDGATSSLAILRTDLMDNPTADKRRSSRSALVTTLPVGSRPVAVVIPDWIQQQHR